MDQNPYQAPATASFATQENRNFRVDGKFLVVESGTVLPLLCVKTNQPLSKEDLVTRKFTWCSPLVGLLILLSGLFLILVYFVVRKKCTLTFGVLPTLKQKYRNRRIFKIVTAIALFFALPFSAALDSTPVILVVLVLFIISIVSLFFGNSPLAITKHVKGEFWITGCSKEFLATLQSQTTS